MDKMLALLRANWMSASSYRVGIVLSLVSLIVMTFPIYFVAGALQPLMAESIQAQGDEYFGFLLVGMIAFSFLTVAVNAVPSAIGGAIGSGTLEALIGTPTRLPTLLAGLISYELLWTLVRALLLIATGALLGAYFDWRNTLIAAFVLGLIILAYLPFGLFAAAAVLAFRTTGPFPKAVLTISGLLGGVYYPTKVIPSWLQHVSDFVPLTYGLRALRRTLLEGLPFRSIVPDLGILLGFTAVLLALSAYAFSAALRYGRRTGTLAQY